MKLKPYRREVFYYESDKMNIVHHSNYIRMFEESRVDMLEQIDMPFNKIEERGLMSPVLDVKCEYKFPLQFGDVFEIRPSLVKFNGCMYSLRYKVYNVTKDKLSAVGETSHCFTDANMKPVRLKKKHPDIYNAFMQALEEDENG